VELVGGAADAVGEEEDVPLEPGDFLGRVFESDAWAAHFGDWVCSKVLK
jgi:hypothetical protein